MRTRTAALGVAMTLLVAACGGSSESADETPAIIIEGATEQAAPATTAEVVDDTTSTVDAGDDATADETSGAAVVAEDRTEEQAALEFAQCIRDEGLDFDDPTIAADGSVSFTPPQGGVTDEFAEAAEECGELLEGASFLPDDDQLTEIEDQLLEFAECLREQGLDVDDPDLSGGLVGAARGGIFGPDFDPEDPANADAIQACQSLLAGLAPGGA